MMESDAAEARPAASGRPVKTALHQAVLDRRIHQVRLLVARHHVNVDTKDVYGRTALALACLLDNGDQALKMVKVFVKAGAYQNAKDNLGRTGLSYACIKGHEEVVKVLLQDDTTDAATADKDGNTPLMFAAVCGQPGITRILVDKLLQFGSQIDARNSLGYTPLLLACKCGNYVSAHILLTAGKASPLLRDNEYYLNALDWLKKGPARKRAKRSFNSLSASFGGYDRDTSYNTNALSRSMSSVLMPGDLNSMSSLQQSEMFIDDRDARSVVIALVSNVIDNSGPRATSKMPGRVRFHDKPPATAKLLAVRDRTPTNSIVPTITTILGIYSDQFDAKPMVKRSSQARNANQRDFLGVQHHLDPVVESAAEEIKHRRNPSLRSVNLAKA